MRTSKLKKDDLTGMNVEGIVKITSLEDLEIGRIYFTENRNRVVRFDHCPEVVSLISAEDEAGLISF